MTDAQPPARSSSGSAARCARTRRPNVRCGTAWMRWRSRAGGRSSTPAPTSTCRCTRRTIWTAPRRRRTRRRAAGRRRGDRRLAGLSRRGVRSGQERTGLHRGPAGGSAGVPGQHAVGLHHLRLRLAGGGGHARPVAGDRACVAGLADTARRSDQLRGPGLGRRGSARRHDGARPARDAGHPGAHLRPRWLGYGVPTSNARPSPSTGWPPGTWRPAKETRLSCCTAVNSAPAPNSVGNEPFRR